jgi:hypothetical protein
MKKLIAIMAFVVATATAVSAQDYNWAIGLRGGGEMGGLTVKKNFGANAIEGIFSIPWSSGFAATVLYERNVPVIADGFNFYYGAGAHVGVWGYKGVTDFALGVDAIVGLEYKIPKAPIALSIDYKPMLNIIEHFGFYWADVALGIKFTF